jgi:uracil-DNA glycosylase family 4
VSPRKIKEDLEAHLESWKAFGVDAIIKPKKTIQNAEDEPTLEALSKKAHKCKRCEKLASSRTNVVFGTGSEHAELVFVGEAPGREEDKQGKPFVGRAGELLTKMIVAMGFTRDQVYICNVLKCRPPENRNPLPNEVENCSPYLKCQLRLLKPKILVALGKFAAQTLLQTETPISQLRGKFHEYEGIPLMPTYHPAYLLRNPSEKKTVWEDLKKVMEFLKPGKTS